VAYGIELIARVLPIAPLTYHARGARSRDPQRLPTRQRREAGFCDDIRRVHSENFGL